MAFSFALSAQEKKSWRDSTYSDIYLDTVQIQKKFIINDYTLVGFNYGAQGNRILFSPPRNQVTMINPVYFGVTYTKYGKMFGYMPYFGLQAGLFYGKEGYRFKTDKETGITSDLEGATEAVMEVVEVPLLAEFHIDAARFRFIIDAGIYGGYRLNIERTGPTVAPEIQNSFRDFDIKLDYGLKGGIGVGLLFDPIEFHLKAHVKYGWSSLYQPDYYSQYYYRYAYPFDICVTAGVHFQLTKRTGKTKKDLRKAAYENVFGSTNNNQ